MRATGARMLGLDRDEAALGVAREQLAEFGDRVVLHRADFGEIRSAMQECGLRITTTTSKPRSTATS